MVEKRTEALKIGIQKEIERLKGDEKYEPLQVLRRIEIDRIDSNNEY